MSNPAWGMVQPLLQYPVHVLVVTPRHHELGDAATGLVHAVFAAEDVVGEGRIVFSFRSNLQYTG